MNKSKHSLQQVFLGDAHWNMPLDWQADRIVLGIAILSGEGKLGLRSGMTQLSTCSICYVAARELLTLEFSDTEAILWPLNPLWGMSPEQEQVFVLDETSAGVLHEVFIEHQRKVEHEHAALQFVGYQTQVAVESTGASPEAENLSQTVCHYMEAHLDENLNLHRLAQQFNCGKQKIIRSFNEELGLTPIKKLAQLRIDKTKDLLQRSDMNVSQIAATVGYSDLPSFSHFFKKHVGVSPSEYRSQIQWLV